VWSDNAAAGALTRDSVFFLSLSFSVPFLPFLSISSVLGEPRPPTYVRFRNLFFRHLAEFLGWRISPSQTSIGQHNRETRAQTCMPWAGFEPTNTVTKPYTERPLWSAILLLELTISTWRLWKPLKGSRYWIQDRKRSVDWQGAK
jgi:hypothetical protein